MRKDSPSIFNDENMGIMVTIWTIIGKKGTMMTKISHKTDS
jgi:hypothetical protein